MFTFLGISIQQYRKLMLAIMITLYVPVVGLLTDRLQPKREDKKQPLRMSKHSFMTEKRIFSDGKWKAIVGPCDDIPRKGSHRVSRPAVAINWYNRMYSHDEYRLMFRLGMKVDPKTTVFSELRFGN